MIEIQTPTEGKVNLDLSWREAEILTRILGVVNSGSLHMLAPRLWNASQDLFRVFGGNNDEGNNYSISIRHGQVYVEESAEALWDQP